MEYVVRIAVRAERDLVFLYGEIDAEYSGAALNWYRNLWNTILSLRTKPNRGSIFQKKLRQLLYGRRPNIYRVIYRVLEKQKLVEILHIRHGARRDPRISGLLP